MKQVLVIGKNEEPGEESARDFAVSLAAAASNDGQATFVSCGYEDLLFVYDGQKLTVTDTQNKCDLRDYSCILFISWFHPKVYEDVALAAALYAQAGGVIIHNAEVIANRSRSKISQCVMAALHDIPSAMFAYSLQASLMAAEAEKVFGFPMIIKSPTASRGNNNYLVHDAKELNERIGGNEFYFMAQGFIPNEGDYRLLVFGGTCRMAIHRRSSGASHLNNTSRGGAAMLVELPALPPGMVAHAEQAARLINREITGVDMIVHSDTQKYYFLEANNMPQLNSGSFVAEKTTLLRQYLIDID